MLTYLEAQNLIKTLSRSFGQELIDLEDADGRVLAEAVLADRDYPPFNRAMVDGFAINTGDWDKGIRSFNIQQTIFAGQAANNALQPGACYKIMTGAPVPLSANAVVRREDAVEANGTVTFSIESIVPLQSIALKGEDMKAGQQVIKAQSVCTPAVISLLASLGKTTLQVERLPRVALFTTGDEVIDPHLPVADTQIRNSNQYLLKALLKTWLIKPIAFEHILDDKASLIAGLSKVWDAEIIITCGGVSAGDADYLPEVLATLGVKTCFHKLAIRPGKPLWCGQLPHGGIVFALPGNPMACLVTFKLFIETYLVACLGIEPRPIISIPFSGTRIRQTLNFDEFFPVTIKGEPSVAQPIAINGSGDIRLGLYAQAIAHHPAAIKELRAGDIVQCMLL